MRAMRSFEIRAWLPLVLLVALALGLSGCKKKPVAAPPQQGAGQEKQGEPAEPAPTSPEKTAEEATAPVDAVAEPEVAPAPPAEEKAAELPQDLPRPPQVATTDTPPPGPDRKRLTALFAEMWCAQRRGANGDELLDIYHKYNYPPLDQWYDLWNEALVDRNWARETVAKARTRCPELVPPKEALDPAKAPELGVPPKPEAEAAPPAADAPAAAEGK
jgi:hypothetical protein